MDNDKAIIGGLVKQFESGTKGSISFSQCENDWGISCGSYQLTLRWGNCIKFLKRYFPKYAKSLYFNDELTDFPSKDYPGFKYCSSPDAVKSAWIRAYNAVGYSLLFFSYEWEYMKEMYYDKIKEKISSIIDLNNVDRAFQECFWSWSINKGVDGCYNAFTQVMKENNIDSLDYVDKEEFFDMIYDKRYEMDNLRRYQKGITDGSSEREVLREFLTPGTFSGFTLEEYQKMMEEESIKQKQEEEAAMAERVKQLEDKINSVIPLEGTIKIIYKGGDGVNIRPIPDFDSIISAIYQYGTVCNVTGITKEKDFYRLDNDLYVTTHADYVLFVEKENTVLYKIRILDDNVELKQNPSKDGKNLGYLKKDQVFSIIEEKNGYGKLKSGSGWILLDQKIKIYK